MDVINYLGFRTTNCYGLSKEIQKTGGKNLVSVQRIVMVYR